MIVFKISEEQLIAFKKAFDFFDRNKNGKIEKDELGEVMKSLGLDPEQSEIDKMMKAVDANKNNVVDFNEFVDLMTVASECPKERINKAFGVLLSEKEVQDVIKHVDIDGEQKINDQDFVAMLKDKEIKK